jgi:thiopeptide-type bacteriocin biosynthesis protein
MKREPRRDGLQDDEPCRRSWLAAHLVLAGGVLSAEADRAILDFIAPLAETALAERQIRRFFFLRYDDGTPHLRFRLCGWSHRLHAEIRPRIERWAGAGRPITRVAWVPYEPEIERYGGRLGVRLAEDLFHGSSLSAIALLRRSAGSGREALLGKALLAAVLLLHTLTGSRALSTAVCRRLLDGGMPALEGPSGLTRSGFEQALARQAQTLGVYLEAAWRRLSRGEALTPELDAYRRALTPLATRLRRLHARAQLFTGAPPAPSFEDSLSRLLPSYLHLMHNRLGVARAEEIYLAGLIARTGAGPETPRPGNA